MVACCLLPRLAFDDIEHHYCKSKFIMLASTTSTFTVRCCSLTILDNLIKQSVPQASLLTPRILYMAARPPAAKSDWNGLNSNQFLRRSSKRARLARSSPSQWWSHLTSALSHGCGSVAFRGCKASIGCAQVTPSSASWIQENAFGPCVNCGVWLC